MTNKITWDSVLRSFKPDHKSMSDHIVDTKGFQYTHLKGIPCEIFDDSVLDQPRKDGIRTYTDMRNAKYLVHDVRYLSADTTF